MTTTNDDFLIGHDPHSADDRGYVVWRRNKPVFRGYRVECDRYVDLRRGGKLHTSAATTALLGGAWW